MDRYSGEKDIQICAVKLHILSHTTIKITVCRFSTGNIAYFRNNLEAALNQVYNNKVDIILCGDFNINYLSNNQNKEALNSLLTSYIHCPTRIHHNSHNMIDNIFINKFSCENYSVFSSFNGLSDHDAQVLSLCNTVVPDDRN